MNNSTTGGYLIPESTTALPKSLTLVQFIQTVISGISGITGSLVRPEWQEDPPKQPSLKTDWIAYGIVNETPTPNSYVWVDSSGNNISQRQSKLEIQCSIYGPNAQENADILRDGLQIQQNLSALSFANMGFTTAGPVSHIPDLVNEKWINRVMMSIFLQREIQREYPILTFVSVSGTITTDIPTENIQPFSAEAL